MKLFYQCYGGAHTSVTCASIHLGYLPKDRIPDPKEFYSVPFYDKMDNDKLGTPVYVGRDQLGWDLYIIGMKNARDIVIPAIHSYLNYNNLSGEPILIANALVELHPVTSVGGFISRKLRLRLIGKPMTVWGIRKSYPKLVDLVERTKAKIKNLDIASNIKDNKYIF